MILFRIKKAEYRDLNEYWAKRLTENPVITKDYIKPGKQKKFDSVVFTCGYPKKTDTSRRIEFRFLDLRPGPDSSQAETLGCFLLATSQRALHHGDAPAKTPHSSFTATF